MHFCSISESQIELLQCECWDLGMLQRDKSPVILYYDTNVVKFCLSICQGIFFIILYMLR